MNDIRQLATECVNQLSSGVIESEDEFLSRYPDLRERIAAEIRKHRLVGEAIDIADQVDRTSTRGQQETTALADRPLVCPECRATVTVLGHTVAGRLRCDACETEFTVIDEAQVDQQRGRNVAHFQLERPLGRGGFGSVWCAYDAKLDRHVALKLPRRGELTEQEAEQFVREARAAARLAHPNIVSVLEVGEDAGAPYIACDLITGQTLAALLSQGPLPAKQAAGICRTIAEAVQTAHNAGVIHRDLKPSNILLNEASVPFVADFGLAKRGTGEVTITADGQLLGTPAYMPPEQASGRSHQADARSDIYSLGAVFYEMLTGETCFRGTVQALIHQAVHADPAWPRQLNRNIPSDLETICLKCLEKNPEHRYQSATELAADLGRWHRKEPIVARPLGPLGRLFRWSARRPAIAALSAAVLIVSLAGASGIAYEWQRERSQRERANTNATAAYDVVDDFLVQVATMDLPDEPRVGQLRAKLLEKAVTHYDALAAKNPADIRTMRRAAYAHLRYGDELLEQGTFAEGQQQIEGAIGLLEECARQCQDPAERLQIDKALATAYLDYSGLFFLAHSIEPAEAIARLHDVDELMTPLVSQYPDDLELQDRHANALAKLGSIYRQQMGPETVETLERSIDLWHRLAAAAPADEKPCDFAARCYVDLAWYYVHAGQLRQAADAAATGQQSARDGLQIKPNDPSCRAILIGALTAQGSALRMMGQPQLAEAVLIEGIETLRTMCADFPSQQYRFEQLAGLLADVGSIAYESDRYQAAVPPLEEAIGLHDEIVERNPGYGPSLVFGAYCRTQLSRALAKLETQQRAEQLVAEAIATLTQNPAWDSHFHQVVLATAYEQMARVQRDGSVDDRLAVLDLAAEELAAIGDSFSRSADVVATRRLVDLTRVELLQDAGRHAQVVSLGHEWQGDLEQSIQEHPESTVVKQCCELLVAVGESCRNLEEYEQALDHFQLAYETCSSANELIPPASRSELLEQMIECQNRLGNDSQADALRAELTQLAKDQAVK